MNMKKSESSPLHRDTTKRIQEDPEFAEAYIEALSESPINVQLAMLRRLRGLPQVKVASKLHAEQAFISRLEKSGSDHRVSIVSKAAKALHGRLVVLPEEARVVFR